MSERHALRALAAALLLVVACGGREPAGVAVPGRDGAVKTTAVDRSARRAYDGAPPVIPHPPFGECVACHNEVGIEVEGMGFAPPMPHGETQGLSAVARCRQCHVFHTTDGVFVENDFVGLRQDLRHGERLNPLVPPVIPHPVFMRERCLACHAGPAAREEIRTPHPERLRCRQCHVEQTTTDVFPSAGP